MTVDRKTVEDMLDRLARVEPQGFGDLGAHGVAFFVLQPGDPLIRHIPIERVRVSTRMETRA